MDEDAAISRACRELFEFVIDTLRNPPTQSDFELTD